MHKSRLVLLCPIETKIAMVRKELEQLNIPAIEDISIDTVERYQGSQRDIIIYSFTIQNRFQTGVPYCQYVYGER